MRHGLRLSYTLSHALLALFTAQSSLAVLADKCAWTGSATEPASSDVMMTVPVGDLDGDGVSDLVFISFVDTVDINAGEDGILRAVSGATCTEIFSVVDVGAQSCVDSADPPASLDTRGGAGILSPGAGLAIGDIDGDLRPEILAVLEGPATNSAGRIVAFEHDGTFKWCTGSNLVLFDDFAHIALADFDGNGSPEIAWGTRGFAATGTPLPPWSGAGFGSVLTTVADLDVDGTPEVVTGSEAFLAGGGVFWSRPDLVASRFTFPAVADFDLDGLPEVVVVEPNLAVGTGQLHLLDGLTGATICQVDIPTTSPAHPGHPTCPRIGGGGPPTLQDIDGDFIPEIGVAGSNFYHLFRFDPLAASPDCLTIDWSQPTRDCSSSVTGSTITDLEGDCSSFEVLYNDELRFRIYDADDGTVLEDIPNGSGTIVENPIVVDLEGDGNAEIVVSANDYAFGAENGVRVLHDPVVPWGPARPVYNQHTYHVTNVNDDSTIPANEINNWELFNNFRAPIPPTAACSARSPNSIRVGGS